MLGRTNHALELLRTYYYNDSMANNTFDIEMMTRAMNLAQRGEGWVNPNPMVGAVIVRNGEVIAEGWHERYGDLHAERNAFKNGAAQHGERWKARCEGTTMYVTLEPCCHHGHQPPCTDAIIEHKVKRVVVGLRDPNPLVAGKGMALLHEAGIEAEYLDSEEMDLMLRKQNKVFLKYITTGMPYVTAKWAMTLDGKIAAHTGDSKWVTSTESRQRVHLERSKSMAILTGIGTVLTDDPMLNVRVQVSGSKVRQPIRIVADREARLPLDSQLVKTAGEIPVVVAHSSKANPSRLAVLKNAGITLWQCEDINDILRRMGKEKIDSVFTECGGTLMDALVQSGNIDEVMAFIAPKIIGGKDSPTPVMGNGFSKMADALQLTDITTEQIGQDVLIRGITSPKAC